MIMESFGLDTYIDEHLHSTNYLLRVMKYKGPDTEETKLGLNAHTDKNIVTILYQNHVEGLEVQTKDNNWIKVKPSQDSFIVMIGDSLHVRLCLYFHQNRIINAQQNKIPKCFDVTGFPEWSLTLSLSPCHDDGNRDKILTRIVLNTKSRTYRKFARRTRGRRASSTI